MADEEYRNRDLPGRGDALEDGRMTRYYFLGIGGTAMASVAIAFKKLGYDVSGSDRGVYPPMSGILRDNGILYHESFDGAHIAACVSLSGMKGTDTGGQTWNIPGQDALSGLNHSQSEDRDPSTPPGVAVTGADRGSPVSSPLFVVGNAISRGNPELEELLDSGLSFTSLAALAGERLIAGRTSLVIAGTHGKTTTTSLAAWVLESAGRAPGFLVGGVPENFGEGCRPTADGGVFVSEGDEYDTAFFDKRAKFVHYRPDIAVINNIEYDHADIYDSLDAVKRSFRQLVAIVPRRGLLLINGDDEHAADVARGAQARVETFGLGDHNTWQATDIVYDDRATRFTVVHRSAAALQSFQFEIALAGEFNVRNALAVVASAQHLGVSSHDIQAGFSTFRSVKRRMEVIAERDGVTVIDDFAHHPTAVRETLRALRQRHGTRRIWILFEPRSNTTTRNIFQRELEQAFDGADIVYLGAVNRPERYAPSELLDTAALAAALRARGMEADAIPDPAAMAARVIEGVRPGDVVAILSNGAFGGLHGMITQGLESRVP